jgi:chemotaxis methyl-accepting protein methylase
MLVRFLFTSFLPDRFYGGIGRYPGQQQFVREWLSSRSAGALHCLDAACGTGEESYGLALLLSEEELLPERIRIDGWTLEPLEVWAATYRRFPHDRRREELFREETATLLERGFQARIRFRCVDLAEISLNPFLQDDEVNGVSQFDLILCNGLLGGPILNDEEQLAQTVRNLTKFLAPDGVLLAADNFHGGWKQKCPQNKLRALFEQYGMNSFEAGEGIGGLKPD